MLNLLDTLKKITIKTAVSSKIIHLMVFLRFLTFVIRSGMTQTGPRLSPRPCGIKNRLNLRAILRFLTFLMSSAMPPSDLILLPWSLGIQHCLNFHDMMSKTMSRCRLLENLHISKVTNFTFCLPDDGEDNHDKYLEPQRPSNCCIWSGL